MGSEEVVNIDGTRGSYDSFFPNVRTSDVKPARSTQHPVKVNPSHLDNLPMDRYVAVLFCYQLADTADATYSSCVDRLKRSLAETLVAFYPMAGRVVKTTDPDHPRQLLFNDLGVPFTEAFLDSEMHSFLNLQDFRPMAYISGFEPVGLDGFRQIQDYRQEGNPALFIQVTRFNCGGIVLAINWNHLIADMTASVSFVTAWSEISRAGSTSIVPEHDRSILNTQFPVSSDSASSNETPMAAAPPSITTTEAAKIQQVLKAKFTVRSLHIRKEAMDKVIRQAKKENPEVSRLDCVCAHLWRGLAKANAQAGISDTTMFTTAVEGRSRMGISPHYFGNVGAAASVTRVLASDIVHKPVSYAASLIRKAIKGITSETYWAIINEKNLRNPLVTNINRTDYQMGLTSWARFGLYDIDFGFGKPIFVGVNLPVQDCKKGQTVVLPSPLGEGNYSVMLSQFPHILEALLADSEFTSVC